MDIDIHWGAYYASKSEDEDGYAVFRLLDFNRDAYHAAIFRERFSSVPVAADIAELSPFVGHAPIDAKSLLAERDLTIVAHKELTPDDLEGYRFYLEHHEYAEDEIEEILTSVVEFSSELPLALSLEIVDGDLKISER